MISDRYGMTEQEFEQALSFDWRDLRIETLERELIKQSQKHDLEVTLLHEDITLLENQVEYYKKKYQHALDYKIFG